MESFDTLAGVPVHYDRFAPPLGYGSKGKRHTFYCEKKFLSSLEVCFSELFEVWGEGKPTIILSAGAQTDKKGTHGSGQAFDLDGFYWGDDSFTMLSYPSDRNFYLGINAHLFMHYSQVLNWHYPDHKDHFHMDFRFAYLYRPESNAQTFFVQACLVYLFGRNIGKTGAEKDGVDGIYGDNTENNLNQVLGDLEIKTIMKEAGWKDFLLACREKAFTQSQPEV